MGMGWSFFFCHQAFADEKTIRRYAQRRGVMKARAASSLEVPEAEVLLALLVIALNAPAQFCKSHEFLDWRVSWQHTEEVFGRLGFSSGPLDKQPLLLGDPGGLGRAGGAVHPYCRKARRQGSVGAFPPCDGAKAP